MLDRSRRCLELLFALLALSSTDLFAAEPLQFSNAPQLFADDYLVETTDNIDRVAHQAQRHNDGKPIVQYHHCPPPSPSTRRKKINLPNGCHQQMANPKSREDKYEKIK